MPRPLPRHLAAALHTTAALVWFGALSFYVRVWLQPRDASGELLRWAGSTVDGTNSAPYQYRILVPHLMVWLHEELGWTGAAAETAIDAVALLIGVVAIAALLRRLHLEVWTLAVAAYGGVLSIGLLWWGKSETITAFAATSVVLWAVLQEDRRRWAVLAPAALVLAGTRTDLLLALGVALLARWAWAGRRRDDLAAGVALGAVGVAATVALKAAYPDATYPVAVVQLSHNLQPTVLLTLIAFIAPALAPWLLIDREAAVRRALDEHRAVVVPTLALVLAEVASLLVVGRVEEVRLLFPLAAALGLLAVLGWRAALGPYASSIASAGAAGGAAQPTSDRVEVGA